MNLSNTRYMQYLAAFAGTLTVTCCALYASWTSPILPKIASGNTPLGNITQEESSWLVSSLLLGQIPGSMISGWTLETFGRKGSLLISGVPLFLAWFPIAFVKSVWLICILRFLVGIAMCNAVSSVMLYNGEIAEKDIRGRLGSAVNIQGLMGDILPFCVGPFISYRALTLASSIVPLIFLITFCFMPESPYYLTKIGRYEDAKKNLKILLRKDTSDVVFDEHIGAIKNTVDEEMKNKSSFLEFLLKKEYRKSLVVSLGVHTVSQLSGFIAILAYMQTILEYSRDSISPEIASVVCGIVQLPTVFIAAAIVDRAGRKPLLIISSLGCAIALLSIGIFFYYQNVLHANVSSLTWIPMVGILLYIVIRPIGFGTVTFILMGELFTTNIKGHAVAVSMFYKSVLAFIVAKTFEPISNAWGMHIMFGFYTFVCICGAAFVYFVVPETKGKTFAEIREKLNKNMVNGINTKECSATN